METAQVRTIDEVIGALTAIVESARACEDRRGYFAALYRRVTEEVRKKIGEGFFEDGPRLEKLDVVFALRYLDAYRAWPEKGPAASSWAFAFREARSRRPIALQHILLGMNAHINFDLGIAAAEVAPGRAIDGLKTDFMRINDILSSLISEVENRLTRVWPLLAWANAVTRKTDDAVIRFSMQKARDHAWSRARELAYLSGSAQASVIGAMDRNTLALARLLRRPGPALGSAALLVRITEPRSVRRTIDMLAG